MSFPFAIVSPAANVAAGIAAASAGATGATIQAPTLSVVSGPAATLMAPSVLAPTYGFGGAAPTFFAPTVPFATLQVPTLAAPTLAAPTFQAPTWAAPTFAAPTFVAPSVVSSVAPSVVAPSIVASTVQSGLVPTYRSAAVPTVFSPNAGLSGPVGAVTQTASTAFAGTRNFAEISPLGYYNPTISGTSGTTSAATAYTSSLGGVFGGGPGAILGQTANPIPAQLAIAGQQFGALGTYRSTVAGASGILTHGYPAYAAAPRVPAGFGMTALQGYGPQAFAGATFNNGVVRRRSLSY